MSRYEMFLQRLSEIELNLNVLAAITVIIVVFILEIPWIRRCGRKSKRVRKAEKLGHVVSGRRIDVWDDDLTRTSVSSYVHATYVYEVNGREYKYHYLKRAAAPLTLNLYYVHDPRRAFTGEIKNIGIWSLLYYIIPLAFGIGVLALLGEI